MIFGTKDISVAPPISAMVETPRYENLADSSSSLKEAVTGTLGTLAAISYYCLGLVQFVAIIAFFQHVWGWWFIPSFLAAGFLAYIPIVGAAAGIYAAVHAWGWSLYAAIALFCFPLIVWLAIMLIAGASVATQSMFSGKTHKHP